MGAKVKTFLNMAFVFGTASAGLFSFGISTAQSSAVTTVQSVDQLQRQHRFHQTKVADCANLPPGFSLDGKNMKYVDGDLTIDGMDSLGHHYSIAKGSGSAGCSIWSANLDGTTGPPDLEIVTPGEDSSGGYDTVLSIILFDHDGRPFPWQVTGKFSTTEELGVDQIVTASASPNASVIV